ncbi:MAG: hypothetical protein E6H67_10650 [Betaproteobacteria bacterium]|nr:MAG: hypothetical protein E6H67_10650 [Betaproteobacteria bacterium]
MVDVPVFKVIGIELFERPVRLRLPFRFGAVTLTEATEAFVRARIRLADGREIVGATAELMVPKWFDKDPGRSNAENVDQLRSSLALARVAYTADATPRGAFSHSAVHQAACMVEGERQGLPALAAAFGPAEVDRAILDALCRGQQISFQHAIRNNVVGFEPSLIAPDLSGLDVHALLSTLAPRSAIALRHTVGLADVVSGHPGRAADGLPESLQEVIAAHRPAWFKIKLGGDIAADMSRLTEIASLLDRLPQYHVTLDGNEQFASVERVGEFVARVRAEPRLERLAAAIAYLEQPLPRHRALADDVASIAAQIPLLIDESDASYDAFPRGRTLGYTGVSSKSCKGLYKSLVNLARCRRWNAEASAPRYFLSAEDLTAQAGLAVQQDLALAALLGIEHSERNGHHYANGMAAAPQPEQQAFLDAHPDLYERSRGAVRLAIRDGMIALGSLSHPGFASGALPDWDALSTQPAVAVQRPRTTAAASVAS